MSELRRAGVPIHHGIRLASFEGKGVVERVCFHDRGGREVSIPCDAVAYGFGLKPETQLADLAGIEFRYDATFRQWLPHADRDGRCGLGMYVAGDGATIGGSRVATLTGTLAACAALEDFGVAVGDVARPALRREVTRLRRFQRGLARAFAWPASTVQDLDDQVVVCRCEGITTGELRAAIRAEFGPTEVNRLKAITRCGMGRCQGRFCGLPAAEFIAHTRGVPLETAGRLRGQPPVKPLPLGLTLAEKTAAAARDETSAPA
jgi:NADPH-dependent 2,4-dienoyl-CoA reductase/sulfur reductase-like enzyme